MKRSMRKWLLLLLLPCLCSLTGCQTSTPNTEAEQNKVCWDLIGEWRYQDADNRFYINLLYANEAMQGVMMNYSFTTGLGRPEEKTVESRNMSTFMLIQQDGESVWRVDGIPENFDVLIRLHGDYNVTVNSKQLTCTRAELEY